VANGRTLPTAGQRFVAPWCDGWGGGLVPFITTWAFTRTGSLEWALAYPIAVPAIAFLLSLWLMPETRSRRIWGTEDTPGA